MVDRGSWRINIFWLFKTEKIYSQFIIVYSDISRWSMMNSSCYSHQGLCISSSGPRPTLVFESDDDCYDDHHFIISSSMSIPNVSDDHSYISYIVTSCSWYIRLYWYRYLNIDDSFQIIMIWWWWWCWWSRRRWAGRQTWIPPRGCNRRSCSPTSMDCSPWILPMTRRLSCRNVPFDKPVLGQYPMTEPNKTAIVTNNPSGIELFFYFQRTKINQPPVPKNILT